MGVIVRVINGGFHSFPLNDGGLFYAMVDDIGRSHFHLPDFTSYNEARIPFAYPPLAFYAAALLHQLTGLSLTAEFRFLPLVVTCLTLPAFYLFASCHLPSRQAALASLIAFALTPRSFIWLIMGGGLTRSFGLVFAILALWQMQSLYRKPSGKALALATVFTTATILSHLETGWFLAFSVGLLFLFEGRSHKATLATGAWAIGTFVLTAPWWLTVIHQHGLGPFLAAQQTGGSIFSSSAGRIDAVLGLLHFSATSEALFPIVGVLALIGMLVRLRDRKLFLPAWWLAIVILDVRAYPTFTTLPIALMAGIGITEVLLPSVLKVRGAFGPGQTATTARAWPLIIAGLLVAYSFGASFATKAGVSAESSDLKSISPATRQAMHWVKVATPANSKFFVVPSGAWETAADMEWFPVLAGRVSVLTVQGSEWLPGESFQGHVKAYENAWNCGYQTSSCLTTWQWKTGVGFSHVFISRGPGGQCCGTLVASLLQDPNYRLVYEGPGASIFARVPAGTEPAPNAITEIPGGALPLPTSH